MVIDQKMFASFIEKKLISARRHPEAPYTIYDYTHRAQFEGVWTPEIRAARGLVIDDNGGVVARPFDKFFNSSEYDPKDLQKETKNAKFVAMDKADGSLGILYLMPNGEPRLTTRGSFVSEQAIEGTKILQEVIGKKLDPVWQEMVAVNTLMFEIIYPENRIVVDYGSDRKLVFLGGRNKDSGRVFTPEWFPEVQSKFESVSPVEDFNTQRDNAEGVVLYYDNGFMVKVKYDEYVRLHRLVTGVTARRVWDLMRNGTGTKELLERVPEEFAVWVKSITKDLQTRYDHIYKQSKTDYKKIIDSFSVQLSLTPAWLKARDNRIGYYDYERITREVNKALNEQIQKCEFPSVVHAFNDHMQGKDIALMIWDMLKPAAEKPFREDL